MNERIKQSELKKTLSKVDLFICSASFEQRSFSTANEICKSYKNFKSLIFYSENEYEEIVSNAQRLRGVLKESNPISVPLNTDRPLKNALAINDSLNAIFKEKSYENILVDITTFTHETLLALYRLLEYKKENFTNLYIIYVCATDYSADSATEESKWLSSGISQIRTVVGYPGVVSPARNNHLIVLFGFESDRTKSLIEELQFDTISLGFGAEGKSIASSFQTLNCNRHTELTKYFSNAHKFELSLIDPFETQLDLQKQIDKYPNYNTVIAPMNTKISTIGAALVAINNPKVQLIYAKPIEYNVKNYSTMSEYCYLYKI